MSYWKIAWRNLQQRGLASTLTALSMALGVAATICVLVVHSVAVEQFSQDAQGYHLIVGGKGGATQLVLSTVYHLDKPLYPIPYSYYREFVSGRFAEVTEVAIPYCLGDSFDPSPDPESTGGAMFRVVATSPDLFDKLAYGATSDGTPKKYEFSQGRNFRSDHAFEAVLGSVVAAQSGVAAGDSIHPTHGIGGTGEKHDAFKVVGVLAPTGTANDRAVFVNIEGFYLLAGHALSEDAPTYTPPPTDKPYTGPPRGVATPDVLYDVEDSPIEPLSEPRREVTSILVKCSSDLAPNLLLTQINKDKASAAQAVAPIGIVTALLEKIVAPLQVVLLALTVLVVIVAAIGVLVSMVNSMNERSRDIAVMRALGANRTAVSMIVLFEAILIALLGGAAGWLLGHGLIALISPYVESATGVSLGLFQFTPWEGVLLPGLVVLAALAGLTPALFAYRTDVAKALSGAR